MATVSTGTGLTAQPGTFEGVVDWYARMRAHEPVSWDEQYGAYHLFGYDDIEAVLSDPITFSSDLTGLMPPQAELELFSRGNFVRMDPPRHDKLRRLVSKAFTPRVVAELAPRITTITDELLDAVAGSPSFDLVQALAYPLPVTVIAELIGVPASDRDEFRRWADSLLNAQLPERVIPDQARLDQAGERLRAMIDYLLAHIRQRRRSPADDLTTTLIAAEVDGEHLTDEEIVGFLGVLLIAGHITTTTLLTNTVWCLDDNRDAATAVRRDPAKIAPMLEEVLRFRSPFPRLARLTTTEATVGGQRIAAGKILMPWVASANRDEKRFPHPDRFDPDRNPNQHLAFGHGIHFCIGAPLARLEARLAMTILLERCRDIEIADGAEFYDARMMTGAHTLPLQVTWI